MRADPDTNRPPGTGEPSETVILDQRLQRIRSTVDGLRLAGTVLVLLTLAGLGTVANGTSAGANSDAGRAIGHLPTLLVNGLGVIGSVSALGALIGLMVRLLIQGRPRVLVEALLAGAVCLAVVALAVAAILQVKGSALYGALTFTRPAGPTEPFDAFLAAWLSFLTVAEIGSDRTWRRVVGIAIAVYSVSVFTAGQATLLCLAMSIALGLSVGVGLRYAVGSVNTRSDAARIATELARNGLALGRIEWEAPTGGRTSRLYRGRGRDGRAVRIVVLDSDQSADGFIYRTWRLLRLQADVTNGPTLSVERVAERRVLLATAARDSGAVLPEYRASASCGPDTMVIAYDDVPSTPLSQLDPPPGEGHIRQLWASAERLHAARLSHPHLTPSRITVDVAGRVLLPVMDDGEALASDLRISLDRAQLLATSAQVVGVPLAVNVARDVLGPVELARALGALQPVVLARETRRWMKRDKTALEAIRAEVRGPDDLDALDVYQVERVRPRTILTLVGIVVAAWLLIGQLGSVDVVSVLKAADWRWVPLIFVASILTYVAASVALSGYVRERLPFVRTTVVQMAADFVGFVLPPAVGGAGLNVQFLRKCGLSITAAGASVATNHIGNALIHILLLTIFAAASGSASETHSPIPGWAFLVIAGLAALVMIGLTLPITRRWLLARILPAIREVLPRLLDLVSNPAKLAQALAGAVFLTVCYSAALYFAMRAFHGDISLLAVAVVFLAGSAVGSAAPTPGGIGAVEAAMSAGLVGAGMAGSAAVSAVLLYRIVTFWLPVPVGWLALRSLERHGDI